MNGPNNPIKWCDYTTNPVKGLCPLAKKHPWCYATRLYKQYKWDETIRLDKKELIAPCKLRKPAKIFVCSTIELFGEWIPDLWISKIIKVAQANPQHTFQFLTEQPEWMSYWVFPNNCWCGVTVQNEGAIERIGKLTDVRAPNPPAITFASFEPLHSGIDGGIYKVIGKLDWIIVGAETGNRKDKIEPKEEWIEQVIQQADHWHLPIFMKDNLKPYWHGELRQEFPE